MANPNPQIWGNTESWIYAPRASGLQTEAAEQGHYAKPKVANFNNSLSTEFKGSLYAAITAEKMVINDFIDESITPCGQDSRVSPWGKIAIFNENNDFSLTPSSVHTFYDQNINWFFADRTSDIPAIEGYAFDRNYEGTYPRGLQYQQYAPKAISPVNANNVNFQLIPYVYYGIKSFVLSIEIGLIPKNSTYVNNRIWTTLDGWKNTYKDTHDMCSLRLFVRNCLSLNSNNLIYNDDKSISIGKSNYIGITNKINVLNDGETIPTQMFDRLNPNLNERCVYIFDRTSAVWNQGAFHTRGILPCWDYFTGQSVKKYEQGNPPDQCYYFYMIPYSDDTYNKCLSIAALFGCYFTPTNKYTFGDTMTDNDLYLSIVDESGVTHGEYTRGSANANNSLYTKNSIRDIDYDPGKPVDPNIYSNTTNFNTVSTNAALTKYYVLDKTNVEKLGDDLWTICDGLSAGDFEHFDGKIKDEFLTTNPIDSIVSIARFPFNIPHTFSNTKTAVQLGKSTGTAQGYRTYNVTFAVNFAGVDIFPRFGDSFLDYSPYTKYELYIPFCGTIEINPGDILGHKLNLSLYVDLLTGSCIAYIFADSLVIGTAKGSCGLDIQMSGAQTATMNANIYNGILNSQLAETQHITSIGKISLNPFKWYENIEVAETRELQANYDITHNIVPLHKMGSASPLLSWIQEFNARLMIYYPEGDVIDSAIPPSLKPAAVASFGHVKGFATATPGIVNDFRVSGGAAFVSGDIVADSIPCTQSERAQIKSFFTTGVYLPPIS